jgi:hypothetical protein
MFLRDFVRIRQEGALMRVRSESVVSVIVLACGFLPAIAHGQQWLEQLGTRADDFTTAAAPDAVGGVYVVGATGGELGGAQAGDGDAWVARYGGAGEVLWIRQFGTSRVELALAAAPERLGGVVLAGQTFGHLASTNAGGSDAWLASYDASGNRRWIQQLGSEKDDAALTLANDEEGGAFVGGSTDGMLGGVSLGWEDAWLARYDAGGNPLWMRQIGTLGIDWAQAAAPDGEGGVYFGGTTARGLGGPSAGKWDAWLARYDGAGNQVWIRQLGTSKDDLATSSIPDGSGGVFLGGRTQGSFGKPNPLGTDAWIARYDRDGNLLWVRQFGSGVDDRLNSASPDGAGGVYLGGLTFASLGTSSAGNGDAWLARFDGAGRRLWIEQLGSSDFDCAWATAEDGLGGVYLSGESSGSLGGPKAGGTDAWLAHYAATR